MGCETSSISTPAITTSPSTSVSNITDFSRIAQQIKQTWPDVKAIPKLGAKTFAHLLHKYPELKPFYHIPEAYKTKADLLNADEIKQPAENFISLYSDIIENSDQRFNEILHEKAIELHNQGIRASQIKFYGESLVHVIKYELGDDLNIDEKKSWDLFSTQVSNGIEKELLKFPRKSIFQ